MKHPTGKIIDPHVHNPVKREVHYTQEVLVIREGKLRADFYDEKQTYIGSRILGSGDVILLIKGGHGFKALENVEMFEVKQGPYAGDKDKIRFTGIDESKIVYNEEDKNRFTGIDESKIVYNEEDKNRFTGNDESKIVCNEETQ
jgi:mannose-6-phosphate isomerase-like protein (cupin superfamily)